jgi:hypothetical protein
MVLSRLGRDSGPRIARYPTISVSESYCNEVKNILVNTETRIEVEG